MSIIRYYYISFLYFCQYLTPVGFMLDSLLYITAHLVPIEILNFRHANRIACLALDCTDCIIGQTQCDATRRSEKNRVIFLRLQEWLLRDVSSFQAQLCYHPHLLYWPTESAELPRRMKAPRRAPFPEQLLFS